MLSCVVIPRGGKPNELIPELDTMRWSTLAVGGFASCSFFVPGAVPRDFPKLSTLRVMFGSTIVWEGRVEDAELTIANGSLGTSVVAYGWKRILEDTSVRKSWSSRTLLSLAEDDFLTQDSTMRASTGFFDPSDLSEYGVYLYMSGSAVVAAGSGRSASFRVPSGLYVRRVYCRWRNGNDNSAWTTGIWGSTNFTSWSFHTSFGGGSNNDTRKSSDLGGGTSVIGVGFGLYGSNQGMDTSHWCKFTDITWLTEALSEDASPGMYGGTVLRDLLAAVPGLTLGDIETGSDYALLTIERAARNTMLSVVQEVASYYAREWAVWEDGRFDWRTVNFDAPDWVVPIADCDALSIQSTVDGLAKTSYVLYTDAASGIDGEQSATSTDQRNPFVKTGATKDEILQPGFVMTSNSASQLAARAVATRGTYPIARGTVVLPANRIVGSPNRSSSPAMLIRAGQNLLLPDLPSDSFQIETGRDGKTLFHISAVDVEMKRNRVTLTLEAYKPSLQVTLAQLAASTRALTG